MTRSPQTRIVYLNHTGLVSGAERVLVNMLHGLDRSRYEPFVICPAEGNLSTLIQAEDVECVAAPAVVARFTWRPDRLWKAIVSLGKAVAAVRQRLAWLDPDLVHANTLRAGIIASLAAIGTGRLVIWHVHDILPNHPLSAAIRFFAWSMRRTQIIAVSHATANSFCGPLPFGNRVHVIHNGTDLSEFPLKQCGNTEFRKRMGIPEEAFLVCAVGQICARKGLLELLEAFERTSESAPQMHLAIAGKVVFAHEERYFESLLRAVAEPGMSGRVHFTGEVRDVSGLLQAADLLVLNSRQEPFGLVLVEAMASGTPVLATRVGGIPEIVEDARNGWLVEKDDTAALSRKLVELSQDRGLLERIAQAAHYETCPQFSLERFQSRLHSLYAEIIPSHRLAIERAHSTSPCQ
jgi:glycosyltransferase involved in cell wall biosynthesis